MRVNEVGAACSLPSSARIRARKAGSRTAATAAHGRARDAVPVREPEVPEARG